MSEASLPHLRVPHQIMVQNGNRLHETFENFREVFRLVLHVAEYCVNVINVL